MNSSSGPIADHIVDLSFTHVYHELNFNVIKDLQLQNEELKILESQDELH